VISGSKPTVGGRLGALARIDMPWGAAQPSLPRFALATAVALAGSLLACYLLAGAAQLLDPATRGYEHFRFADYGRLTALGVLIACLAWPVVAWFSSQARRVFLVLAVLVTLASFAPDVWIGIHGQPLAGVLTLVLMHVALLVVTYPALVLLAPQERIRATAPLVPSP
jgi:hypothetical protein